MPGSLGRLQSGQREPVWSAGAALLWLWEPGLGPVPAGHHPLEGAQGPYASLCGCAQRGPRLSCPWPPPSDQSLPVLGAAELGVPAGGPPDTGAILGFDGGLLVPPGREGRTVGSQ